MKKILILVLALGGVFVFTLAFASLDINLKYGSRGGCYRTSRFFTRSRSLFR